MLKQRGLSSFRLARHVWLLAAFGFIHAAAEWSTLLIPYHVTSMSPSWTSLFLRVQELAWAVSFAFLMQFAALMIAPRVCRSRLCEPAGWYAATWSAAIVFTGVFALPSGSGEALIRYLLAFPAASLAGGAGYRERRSFAGFPSSRARKGLSAATACFIAYAIVTGLFMPSHNLLPGMDYESVLSTTGLPIEAFRMAVGLFIALSIISTLSFFDTEIRHRVRTVEKQQALIDDRKRIARDLHDGTIQSIYAVGLQLEAASGMLREQRDEETRSVISDVLDRLNSVITDIRYYIFELDFSRDSRIMEQQINDMIAKFSTGEPVDVRLRMTGERKAFPLRLQHNIILIIQECLSNIARHSMATEAVITLDQRSDGFGLTIEDNGTGISAGRIVDAIDSGTGGLSNICQRTEALGGRFEYRNRHGGGFLMRLFFPAGQPEGAGPARLPEPGGKERRLP